MPLGRGHTSHSFLTVGIVTALCGSMLVLALPGPSLAHATGPSSIAPEIGAFLGTTDPVISAPGAAMAEPGSPGFLRNAAGTSVFGSSATSASGVSHANPGGRPGASESGSGSAANVSLVTGSVSASVDGYGVPPTLSGVNVTAYNESCSTLRPQPSTCPVVNWTATNASGDFQLNLSKGSYYVAVLPDTVLTGGSYPDGFGGASKSVSVKGPASVRFTVYPAVPYDNASFVLPGYTCFSKYLNNMATGGPGCQNPVLSWTQDGAFYINTTNELVFYSFINRTLTGIAPWTPLYQTFPDYPMIPNELFITQDGSYLYSWGTLTSTSTTITAEALNVTTHEVFLYSFTGVTTSSVVTNGQVELTGWDGNDSDLTLIVANRTIYLHNLWGSGQSTVATLDFFEANNIYWEPFLNAYVNIQADGSSSDNVEEWQLTGPSGYTLTKTFEGRWASGRVVNGVNGVALNLTAHTLSFGLGASSGGNGVVADLNGSGSITGFSTVVEGAAGALQMGPAAASDRPTLVTSGPELQGYYAGFDNGSWLLQFTAGHLGYETTNLSDAFIYGEKSASYDWSQWFQEGQYYNASYLIAPNSYACGVGFLEACAVNGDGGAPLGTIWWYWEAGLPEFPQPASAPMAEELPPAPTDVTTASATLSSLALDWTNPDSDEVVNYTLSWGTTPSLSQHLSLPGSWDSDTLAGLEHGTRYYFAVQAWNLHSRGPSGGLTSALTLGPLPPTGVTASRVGPTNVTWTWDQSPSSGILNDTVYLYDNASCGGLLGIVSSGGPSTSQTFEGLDADHPYSVVVSAWNESGESSGSSCAGVTTLPATPENYSVTFSESGLPSGDFWKVEIAGGPTVLGTGSISSVSTYLPNGTYDYVVGWVAGYRAPKPGTFGILGRAAKVHLGFTEASYTVKFRETGLTPAWGTTWCVRMDSVENCTTSSAIHFSKIPNGTYLYIIGHVSNYSLKSPYYGVLIVAGGISGTVSNTVTVPWKLVTYPVTFSENGLPRGTNWSVVLNGKSESSMGAAISIAISNGTYRFSVGANGFVGTPSQGNVTVAGSPLTVEVSFAEDSGSTAGPLGTSGASPISILVAIPVVAGLLVPGIRRTPIFVPPYRGS